jgi:hypothetical protein
MWERRTAVACHNTGISLKPELPSGRLGLDATTRKRLLRWVLVVTLGEAVGFTVPAAVGVALTPPSWGSVPTLVAMVLAGSLEGALLGAAQADCLFRWGVLPVRRWWIVATSLGAAVAWSLGMLPSTLSGLTWTAGLTVVAGIGALILLTSLPLAQYFVLRDHVRRAALWIPINMVAWLLGIAWTLAPSPWVDQSTSTGPLILVYGAAGLCMAATVAVVTGVGMMRLLRTAIKIATGPTSDLVDQ